MSTDLLSDLGERLDRLATANAPGLTGLEPAEEQRDRRGLILLAAVAGAIALFVIARPGPDVATESPAEEPEPQVDVDPEPAAPGDLPPPTFSSADLPAVFNRPIDDEPRPLVDFGTARTVELPDGQISVGTQGDHLLCATVTVQADAAEAGGSGCIVPAAYLSTRVATMGPLGVTSPDGETTVWYGGIAPLDTVAVFVDGEEADFVDGVFLHQTDTRTAVVEFALDDGTVFRPEIGGPAVPRNPASADGSVLSVSGEADVDLSSAGCIRHEHGWDAFAADDQSWFSVRQDAGVAVSVDGGDLQQTTSWETAASEYDGGVALTITWADTTTSGEAFLVCGDHDAELAIFTGEGDSPAGAASHPSWATLPPWVNEPIIDLTAETGTLVAPVAQSLDERFDLSTLRRLPVDGEVVVGLSDDHTEVRWALIDDQFGMTVTGAPIIRLLGNNVSGWASMGPSDNTRVWGLTPNGVTAVETESGEVVPTPDGAYLIPGASGTVTFIDESGQRHVPASYPMQGAEGARLTLEGDIEGSPLGLRSLDQALCLDTDDGLQVWAMSGTTASELLIVRRDSDQIVVEWLARVGLRFGTASDWVTTTRQGDETTQTSYTISSDSLDATVDVACPADTPHLDDIVAVMRGQG